METKEQTIARIALGIEFDLPDTKKTTRNILNAIHQAYSAGFEAGFAASEKAHSLAMEALEGALANR